MVEPYKKGGVMGFNNSHREFPGPTDEAAAEYLTCPICQKPIISCTLKEYHQSDDLIECPHCKHSVSIDDMEAGD